MVLKKLGPPMPDIRLEASHIYWKNYQDPDIIKVLRIMEHQEDWTLDGHPPVEDALSSFGSSLDDIEKVSLKEKTKLIESITHLKASRFLYILQI